MGARAVAARSCVALCNISSLDYCRLDKVCKRMHARLCVYTFTVRRDESPVLPIHCTVLGRQLPPLRPNNMLPDCGR